MCLRRGLPRETHAEYPRRACQAQAPAMRHTDDDLVRTPRSRVTDDRVEHRHEHIAALDRKPLLPEKSLLEVVLEGLDLRQPLEKLTLAPGVETLEKESALRRLANPIALRRLLDMVVFVADR